jgi:hypothetical protein
MRIPYTAAQFRKALVAIVGAAVALAAHYDIVIGDAAGDAVLVLDLLLTPLFVFAVPNEKP